MFFKSKNRKSKFVFKIQNVLKKHYNDATVETKAKIEKEIDFNDATVHDYIKEEIFLYFSMVYLKVHEFRAFFSLT